MCQATCFRKTPVNKRDITPVLMELKASRENQQAIINEEHYNRDRKGHWKFGSQLI